MLCCYRYKVKLDNIGLLSKSFVNAFVSSTYSADNITTVLLLLELLFVKFHVYTLTSWTDSEITEFINLLSTTQRCFIALLFLIGWVVNCTSVRSCLTK